MGLAIVKHVVTRHRGRLDIQSKPGKGSTFTVVLPAADWSLPIVFDGEDLLQHPAKSPL